MPENNEKFFCNKECKYFPCHPTEKEEEFNCLYCFCPLYVLGEDCGGDFIFTENGIKDCKNCTIPHTKNGEDFINKKINEVVKMDSK